MTIRRTGARFKSPLYYQTRCINMTAIKCVWVCLSYSRGLEFTVTYQSGTKRVYRGWCPATVREYLKCNMGSDDNLALYRYGEVLVSHG